MSTIDYINEMLEKRRYLSSVVHILETADPRRYDQMMAAATGGSKLLLQPNRPDWDFSHKFVWNLQTGQLMELQEQKGRIVEQPVPQDPMIPVEGVISNYLSQEPTLLFVKWVFSKTNVSALENWFLHWAQNSAMKTQFSLVIVFTWDLSFFSPEIQRWCDTYKVPISLDEERRYILQEVADALYLAEKKRTDALAKTNGNGSHADAPIMSGPLRMSVTSDMISATRGLNLHDTMTAGRRSYSKFRDFRLEVFSEYKVKNILSAYNIRYIQPKLKFDDVKGFDYFKNYLRQRILDPLVHPERYLDEGIEPPKGLMMYGPPGVGKTYTVYALAAESGLSVVELSSADILSKYVGESESRVRQLTEIIESLSPVIVFVDEADELFMNRASMSAATDSGVSNRMTSGLLKWLGSPERRAFVVGATNFIERIDSAFLRVGRFDKTSLVLYPDYKSRLELLRFYSRTKKLVPGFDFEPIARATSMWNCAELSALPSEAAIVKFNEGKKFIEPAMYQAAMAKAFRIDSVKRKKEVQEYIDKYQKHAPNYEPFLLDEAKKSFQDQDTDVYNALLQGMTATQ
jgi:AAA+ superfamily predicted ATPase